MKIIIKTIDSKKAYVECDEASIGQEFLIDDIPELIRGIAGLSR